MRYHPTDDPNKTVDCTIKVMVKDNINLKEIFMKAKNKLSTKLLAGCLAVVSVFSVSAMMASAASNVTDEVKTYTYNGDGGALGTRLRDKKDSTSSYIFNYSTSQTGFAAGVGRSNNTRGCLADRYYASSNGAFNMGKLKYVGIGQERYLPNYVYEDNYKYANVHFYPSKAGSIKIAWSPDSV